MQVGLIGVGRMGEAIGKRLLDQGFGVVGVVHLQRARLETLLGLGAEEAPDIVELIQKVDVVLTCVTSGAAQRAVMTEVLPKLRPDQLIIDCSTGSPEDSAATAVAAEENGAHFIDAAILHSIPQTLAGEAVLLVGGKDDAVDKATPVLEAFSRKIIRAGVAGRGHELKLFSNALVHSMLALTCELAAHAKSRGIDLETLRSVYMSAGAASKVVDMTMQAAATGEHNPNAVIKNTLNGLKSYLGHARTQNAHTPVTDGAYAAYRIGVGSGLADDPITCLAEALAEQNTQLKGK